MMAYYFAEDADRNGVYSFLKLNEATGFFSRNKKTGKYSSYVIEEFGYPSGDVSDTEDSDDEFQSYIYLCYSLMYCVWIYFYTYVSIYIILI